MQVLIIDNHDSLTFNLVELIRQSGVDNIIVIKNDEIDQKVLKPADKIIISPGPGLPSETANLFQVIDEFAATHSILGICLGFQAIVEAFGGSLKQLKQVQHGVVSFVNAGEEEPIFRSIESPFPAGRYHSWVADEIPECLQVTAWTEGIVMGVRHKQFDVQGLQFHPESFLTPSGSQLMKNWLYD